MATGISIVIAIVGISIMVADKSGDSIHRESVAALGSAFGFAIFKVALRWANSGEMLPAVSWQDYSV